MEKLNFEKIFVNFVRAQYQSRLIGVGFPPSHMQSCLYSDFVLGEAFSIVAQYIFNTKELTLAFFCIRLCEPTRSSVLIISNRKRLHEGLQVLPACKSYRLPCMALDLIVRQGGGTPLVPRVLTNYGKKSFFYRGAILWNNLSLCATGAATLSSFKKFYFDS